MSVEPEKPAKVRRRQREEQIGDSNITYAFFIPTLHILV